LLIRDSEYAFRYWLEKTLLLYRIYYDLSNKIHYYIGKIIKSSFTAAFQLIFVEKKPCSVQYCPTVARRGTGGRGQLRFSVSDSVCNTPFVEGIECLSIRGMPPDQQERTLPRKRAMVAEI
jgi:hypothetical protein